MTSNFMNEDLRSIKTKKALYTAMFSLLRKVNFKKMTIKEICEEALVSRATFYAHFVDKYDLLKHWLPKFWPEKFKSDYSYEQVEKVFNQHIKENKLIFKNLIYEADNETYDILFDFILSTININIDKNSDEIYAKNIVLSNFYASGIISYLTWQVKNKFPPNVSPMNKYLYEILQKLQN